jgi:lipid-A-disaccharide synthase
MKRVLFSAGEASADIHAANLIKAISNLSKEKIEFTGLGGDAMINTGLFTPEFYNRDFAVFGLLETLGQIPKIYSALRYFKKMANHGSYDAAILLDYPGFNMALAKHLKKKNIPVIYYICPQVWAWKSGRAHKLDKYTSEMLTIFPFEKDFYSTLGIKVKYVGHPLLDEIKAFKPRTNIKKQEGQKIVAVLPGSRIAELDYILATIEKTCSIIHKELNGNVRFLVPVAPTLRRKDLEDRMSEEGKKLLEIMDLSSYDIYSVADHVLLASGTATVEAALFEVPMTIVYKVSALSAFLFKKFIRYDKPIGMVNLLLGKKVFSEFFQNEAVPSKIAKDVLDSLTDKKRALELKAELTKIKGLLSVGESPSIVAAKEIIKRL